MINSQNNCYKSNFIEDNSNNTKDTRPIKKYKKNPVNKKDSALYRFLFEEDKPLILSHIMQFVGIETSLPVVTKDKFKWQKACINNVQHFNHYIEVDPFFAPYIAELASQNRLISNLLKDVYLLIYDKVRDWGNSSEKVLKKTLDTYQTATHPTRLKELIQWNRDQNLLAVCPALSKVLTEFKTYYEEITKLANDNLYEEQQLSVKADKIRDWFLDSENQKLLVAIEDLDLEGLALNELPSELFLLTSLIQTNLSHNNLSVLPPEISQWKNLTEINLAHNRLSILPKEIEHWTHINIINLNVNILRCLPPQIKYWTQLQEIFLEKNNLSYLPPEIAEWKQLKIIELSENKLICLPQEINYWTNLVSIFAGHNKITKIPPEASAWNLIEIVSLEENKIKSIGNEVSTWTNLFSIKLNNNRIKKLTSAIGKWLYVEEVDLNNNPIKNLPKEARNWTRIKKLGLANNKLNLLTVGEGD